MSTRSSIFDPLVIEVTVNKLRARLEHIHDELEWQDDNAAYIYELNREARIIQATLNAVDLHYGENFFTLEKAD